MKGALKVAAGNEGYQRVGGYVSGAISDNWVGRVAASVRQDDGNMREVLSGKTDGQEADAFRLTLMGNISESTQVEFTAQTTNARSRGQISPSEW